MQSMHLKHSKEKIWAYLNRDLLKHIVHLKMLTAHPEAIQPFYITDQITDQGSEGVLLLLEAQAFPYDARTYPSATYIVLATGDTPEIYQKMCELIPKDVGLVFKLVDDYAKDVFCQPFSLTWITAFLSFTAAENACFTLDEQVTISDQLDHRLLPLYAQNGYEADEVAGYFNQGQAISYAIFDGENPLSACMTFLNYDHVWEIGGLHTIPTERQKGLAKRVVETALHTLLKRGYVPRYQVYEENIPSIRAAESVGLRQFLSIDHYRNNFEL